MLKQLVLRLVKGVGNDGLTKDERAAMAAEYREKASYPVTTWEMEQIKQLRKERQGQVAARA